MAARTVPRWAQGWMGGMGSTLELTLLRCPGCGADLQFAPDLKLGTCKYCGAQVALTEKPLGALGTDVDKMKAAIELQKRELAEHEKQLSDLNAEIKALEASAENLKSDKFMVIMMLMFAGLFFDLFLWPLFYFLDITSSFGMSKGTCGVLGLTVLIILLAVTVWAWVARGKDQARRREEVLQSSEYQRKVQRRTELEAEIKELQSGIDRSEARLIEMLQGTGRPPQ